VVTASHVDDSPTDGLVVELMIRTRSFSYSLALVSILGILVASACSAPAPASTPPASGTASGGLVAQQASVDLGQVPFGVQAEGRFDLTNTSDQPVKLLAQPEVKMLEGC
jgi:hypothetical protein